MGPPLRNGFPIRLPSEALWFLRRDAAVLEPTEQVPPVEVDAPLAADDFSDATTSPEVGGEAKRLGTLAKPREYLSGLDSRQLGGAGWRTLGVEAMAAVATERRLPAEDGPLRDLEELRHFGDRGSVLKVGDGESPPPFEFGRRAGWSHTRWYADPKFQSRRL